MSDRPASAGKPASPGGDGLPPLAPRYDLRTGEPLASDDSGDLGIWSPDNADEDAVPSWGHIPTGPPPGGSGPAAATWPAADYAAQGYPPAGYPGQASPTHGYPAPGPPAPPRSSSGLRISAVVAGVLVVAAAAVLGVLIAGRGGGSPGQATGTSSSGTSSAGTSGGSGSDRLAFVRRVDGILSESSTGRQQVSTAITGVQNGCSVSPRSAADTVAQVIVNRQSVLSQASALSAPDAATRTAQTELVSALNASIDANRAYQRWLQNLTSTYDTAVPAGCPGGQAPTDSDYAAATAASGRATAAKQAFVADYNPLAAEAGLRTWAESQF
jgi:hypothetical protein